MPPTPGTTKRPLKSGDWRRRRLLDHAPLVFASAVVLLLFMTLPTFTISGTHEDIFSGTFPQSGGMRMGAMEMDHNGGRTGASFMQQSNVATGYVALGLLGLTLLVGPANLLLRRRNPVSSYLTRDVGIWTALFGVIHVILGLQVHGTGQILDYFILDARPLLNSVGLGNWIGLAALAIVVMLLALSSDAALRELKAKTWKDLQRLNYTLFALVILHAFFYGALVRITSPFTLLGIVAVIVVVAAPTTGIWLWRRKYGPQTYEAASLPTLLRSWFVLRAPGPAR